MRWFPWFAMVTGAIGIVINAFELAGYGHRPTWLAVTLLAVDCLLFGWGLALLLFIRSGGKAADIEPPRPAPRSAAALARVRRQIRWFAFGGMTCGLGVIVAGVVLRVWVVGAVGGGLALWGLVVLIFAVVLDRRTDSHSGPSD